MAPVAAAAPASRRCSISPPVPVVAAVPAEDAEDARLPVRLPQSYHVSESLSEPFPDALDHAGLSAAACSQQRGSGSESSAAWSAEGARDGWKPFSAPALPACGLKRGHTSSTVEGGKFVVRTMMAVWVGLCGCTRQLAMEMPDVSLDWAGWLVGEGAMLQCGKPAGSFIDRSVAVASAARLVKDFVDLAGQSSQMAPLKLSNAGRR